ncbi:MAG: polynucleotide adenylyltransferase PcnB [Methylococcaceae bacterium]|nr:polynucleotide adenylyltransferase PcnB [Methylococcaceae bacterium]
MNTVTGRFVILNFFKKIIGTAAIQPLPSAPVANAVTIYTRSEHPISRTQISAHALKVLYQLKKSGYAAYLVGGCVRDLLLGREPKDFDVVTDATPDQIRKVFRNCRLIGRRFRLAHIYFGHEYIEVATFRGRADAENDDQKFHESGQLLRDNIYGTIEEDVWRRDFTVNSLYYNIRDFSVVDYTGGMQDHRAGVMKLIGDPVTRYREDPVRMLRAVRFAVKLGFVLDAECQQPLRDLASLLHAIPSARLYEEFLKLFLSGYSLQTYEMLRHYGLFGALFPGVDRSLNEERQGFPKVFIAKAFENSDKRVADGLPVTPYFLLAALLWDSVQALAKQKIAQGIPSIPAQQMAASEIIGEQVQRIAFPKYMGIAMRDVWYLQSRFHQQTGTRPFKLITHPRFRAAYDFLLLRAETGDVEQQVADWWTAFQVAEGTNQTAMTQASSAKKSPQKRRHRSKSNRNKNSVDKPTVEKHD